MKSGLFGYSENERFIHNFVSLTTVEEFQQLKRMKKNFDKILFQEKNFIFVYKKIPKKNGKSKKIDGDIKKKNKNKKKKKKNIDKSDENIFNLNNIKYNGNLGTQKSYSRLSKINDLQLLNHLEEVYNDHIIGFEHVKKSTKDKFAKKRKRKVKYEYGSLYKKRRAFKETTSNSILQQFEFLLNSPIDNAIEIINLKKEIILLKAELLKKENEMIRIKERKMHGEEKKRHSE